MCLSVKCLGIVCDGGKVKNILYLVIGILIIPSVVLGAGLTIRPVRVNLGTRFVVKDTGLDVGANARLVLHGACTAVDGSKLGLNVQLPAVKTRPGTFVVGLTRDVTTQLKLTHSRCDLDAWIISGNKTSGHTQVTLEFFPPTVKKLTAGIFGFQGKNTTEPPWWGYALMLFGIALFLLMVIFALFAGMASWVERRIAGRMQNRIGPNRVGPQGVLQWLADGLKNFFKEDFIPPKSMHLLFKLGPYLPMIGVVGTFVSLPFGAYLIMDDMPVGILYIMGIASLSVIGILMGGFASNNKWSLLGAFRSAAQIVSYEVPTGIAVMMVVLLSGTMSMQGIIHAQGGWPWHWYIFANPFTFAAFFIAFTGLLAEGNRTPFDLAEGESELVNGYNTEYSGMRFLMWFFAEWGNLYVMSAILTVLFLGGWQIPGVSMAAQENSFGMAIVGWLVFTLKDFALVFVAIWLRWTLPRIRIDQLMNMCWKYLVPLGMLMFLLTAAWRVFVPQSINEVTGFVMFGIGVFLTAVFLIKVGRVVKKGPYEVYPSPFI